MPFALKVANRYAGSNARTRPTHTSAPISELLSSTHTLISTPVSCASCSRRIAADRPAGPIAPHPMSLLAGRFLMFGVHRNPHCGAPGCRWKDEPGTVVMAEEHDLHGALITLGLNANATPRPAA